MICVCWDTAVAVSTILADRLAFTELSKCHRGGGGTYVVSYMRFERHIIMIMSVYVGTVHNVLGLFMNVRECSC